MSRNIPEVLSNIVTDTIYYNKYIKFRFPRNVSIAQARLYVQEQYPKDYIKCVEVVKDGMVFKIESPLPDIAVPTS